jgi:protein-S-isoprenylcysteine O-methyltransferase Ste14
MVVDSVEQWIQWVGATAAVASLAFVLVGLLRGLRRLRGRGSGRALPVLRPVGLLLVSIGFFGGCFLLWDPLPLRVPLTLRIVILIAGATLYFPGLALLVWARLTLGPMHNFSSSLGAQLYADHQLVTEGPFAIVRHPMYLGLQVATLGGLLLYRTWTTVFLVPAFLLLALRARQEEKVLAAEFGDRWLAYCRRVPMWLPRFWGKG